MLLVGCHLGKYNFTVVILVRC